MVILRMTKRVPDAFECEQLDGKLKDGHLVRPCERYNELYRGCKTIRSRIQQYYVYGETLDCSPHKNNYKACLQYRHTRDASHLDTIIEWEKNLINTRLKTVEQNTTWKRRETPPADFDRPLPEFLKKRSQRSIFRNLDQKSAVD